MQALSFVMGNVLVLGIALADFFAEITLKMGLRFVTVIPSLALQPPDTQEHKIVTGNALVLELVHPICAVGMVFVQPRRKRHRIVLKIVPRLFQ